MNHLVNFFVGGAAITFLGLSIWWLSTRSWMPPPILIAEVIDDILAMFPLVLFVLIFFCTTGFIVRSIIGF